MEDVGSVFADVRGYLRWVERIGCAYISEDGGALRSFLDGEVPKVQNVVQNVESKFEMPKPVTPVVTAAKPVVVKPTAVAPRAELPQELSDLRDEIAACTRCELSAGRTTVVFGDGAPNADLVFIGEAPGANEDKTGIPFCGAAGTRLNSELSRNGISREEVFVVNCLKCRPPENRDPSAQELAYCEEFLIRQLDIIKPKMLCVLGRIAAAILLKRPVTIMRERGQFTTYHGLPLFICLHPAAILHNPNHRSLFEDDIKTLATEYHKLKGAATNV